MAIFDWFKTKAAQDVEDKTKVQRRSPVTVDITENIKVNGELTRGVLRNSYPGFKLAGALAYAPIHTPVSIMGIPIPKSDDENALSIVNDFVIRNINKIDSIHASSHGDGTIWVWPFFNVAKMAADIELIIDDRISDIIKDINTNEIIEIISSEQITIQNGFNSTKNVIRTRSWKKDIITDTKDGVTTISRNPLGIMPIPFANDPDIGMYRGHSDLERIIPDLKVYHDVKLQWATMLSKYQPFIAQEADDVDAWLSNNGFESLLNIDVKNMGFVINKAGTEKTKYESPPSISTEYSKFLETVFYAIVQGSSIPEIAWGLVSTGNHASSEEQMERLMSYCRGKQRQATANWATVFRSILAIESKAKMMIASGDLDVEWNRLDSLSESTKSEIFAKIAEAVQKLTDAGAPGEIIHAQLSAFYPEDTINDYMEFREQRQDAAKYKQFRDASYLDTLPASEQG